MSSAWAGPSAEPVRGGHPEPAALELPGIEQLRTMIAAGPEPPLGRLTGMRLVAVGDGTATFELPASEWLLGPGGRIPAGPLTIPVDGAMACAIMSQLPARTPFTTSELTFRMLVPPDPGTTLTAHGRVIAAGDPVTLAEATLHDELGRLVGHASSLCVTQASAGRGNGTGNGNGNGPVPVYAEADPAEDPWRRPAPSVRPGGDRGAFAGLADGSLTPPPLYCLTGLEIASLADGEAEVRVPASPWFTAPPPGRLQGGVIALVAEAAQTAALATALEPGTTVTPMELGLNLLRPLASDGRIARAHGRVVNAGRRLAVAGAEVSDADGRLIAIATGSGLVQRDR